MTEDNDPYFNYRKYLGAVVAEDVRFVNEKDRTYGGSWKRSGGRNAWFMLKRKIDRLVEMMKVPDPPVGFPKTVQVNAVTTMALVKMLTAEDIFNRVAFQPGGEDGTVLAEIRDLRRYLMLVEAEAMGSGAVAEPDSSADGTECFVAKPTDIVWTVTHVSIDPLDNVNKNGGPAVKIHLWALASLIRSIPTEQVGLKNYAHSLLSLGKNDPEMKLQFTSEEYNKIYPYLNGASVPGTPEDGGHHAGAEETEQRSEFTYTIQRKFYDNKDEVWVEIAQTQEHEEFMLGELAIFRSNLPSSSFRLIKHKPGFMVTVDG